MNVFCMRGAKRWMLCAATGMILIRPDGLIAADRGSGNSQEPARILPAENSRPLLRLFSKNQPAVAVDGAVPVPLPGRTTGLNSSQGVRVIPTQNSAPAAASGEPTAIERELQKLYDRDGRKMPPMRKPIVPNAGGANGAAPYQVQPRDGEVAGQPGQPGAKPGVLQRLNPFNKKATAPTTPPATMNPPQAPAVPAQPPVATQPAVRSTTPSVPGSAVPPAAPRFDETLPTQSAPMEIGSDFEDPFPEGSESTADRSAPQSRPAPSSVPTSQSTAAPQERPESTRPAVREIPTTAPSEKAEDNPFTGLKLDAPPMRRETAPAPRVPERSEPSQEASSVPGDNPFQAPRPERVPASEPARSVEASPSVEAPELRTENLPRATSRPAPRATTPTVETEAAPSFPTPSSEPTGGAEQPQLKFPGPSSPQVTPEESPFEPPVVTTRAPKLTAPSTESRPARNAPEAGWSPTRSRAESRTSAPEIQPHTPNLDIQPREIPRTQPPKPLDPEPAAEVPTTKAQEHERKLRLIAQRKGQAGFKGFCPVTLRETRDLVDSSPDFQSTFEGSTYQFASAEAKAKFDRHPTKYAPAAGGNDVILLGNFGREIPGSIEHALWYRDRLHLFSSRDSLETFLETLGSQSGTK